MSEIAVQAEHLSKHYRIGRRRRVDTLRDQLADGIAGLLTRGRRRAGGDGVIWALRDASFQVKRGEVLGVIGRNGAGKSTLLKILSRITDPTEGRAEIHGRVGSLLEVGAGFHPELTGRENVYLNGAVLGMRKREIDRKFDDIIGFAEVESFVDVPVKRYSSGMYVRLAFSVAAHLEPSILLVDEVLAVGDARFFSKSIAKMRALNARGMTIMLVTHDLYFIQTMCSRAICLEQGRIVVDGTPLEALATYRHVNERLRDQSQSDAPSSEKARIVTCRYLPKGVWDAANTAFPESGMAVVMEAHVRDLPSVRLRIRVVQAGSGMVYFSVYSDPIDVPQNGRIECEATIPQLMLLPGDYLLCGSVCTKEDDTGLLAEVQLPFQVRGTAAALEQESSLFWNRVHWNIRNGRAPGESPRS